LLDGAGEGVDLGDGHACAPAVEPEQLGADEVPFGAGEVEQCAEFFFGDPGGQDLPGRVAIEQTGSTSGRTGHR